MKIPSIQLRLMISVALIQIAGAAIGTDLVVRHEREQSYKVFDASLGEHAAILQTLVDSSEQDGWALRLHRELLVLPPDARYRLVDATGRVIDASTGWSAPPATPSGNRRLIEFQSGGEHYRALMLSDLSIFDPEPEEHHTPPTFSVLYAIPTTATERHIQKIAIKSMLAGLLLLLPAMFASAWAVRRGLEPLRQLAGRAAEIDSGHWTFAGLDESERVAELVPLAAALKHLIERLHAAFERERSFFADAAHEMKTSVAIVGSTLQLALESDRTAAEYRDELKSALADTNRMQTLVASMLELVRMEANSALPTSTPANSCEVGAQLQQAVRSLDPVAAQAGIRVVIQPLASPAWIAMPDDHLQLALTNLLENAIKYSQPGQVVNLTITTTAQECTIDVQDHGCGISAQALPHIFERFYRSDESRTRATGGNGLGLSIARAVVQKAGGSISATSTVGLGSSFTITMPTVNQI
jgi:signal transduction histidine kinase